MQYNSLSSPVLTNLLPTHICFSKYLPMQTDLLLCNQLYTQHNHNHSQHIQHNLCFVEAQYT